MVLSGPSGVGKGTLADMLVKNNENIALSISCTTRAPRGSETDGKEYFFLSKDQFFDKINNGGLLEYSEHFENYYGTPKDYVMQSMQSKDVLLEIDVNGGLQVKKSFQNAVLIFVEPPSIKELVSRLKKRNTEGEEQILNRIKRVEFELDKKNQYDYSVINDDLEQTYLEILAIINKEKERDI